MQHSRWERVVDDRLGTEKSLPPAATGATADEFLASGPRLSSFGTPLLVLSGSAMDANVAHMAAWCAERGISIAPHGKTTMAPQLWRRQLRAGAWGITVATWSQARVAVDAGVERIMLANALVDPVGLAWLRAALDADPQLQVLTWADSPATVGAMEAALTPGRPVTVLVELGGPGGRTGARSRAEALAAAEAVTASPLLRLGGVAGYEGSLAHDSTPSGLAAVEAYLEELAALHRSLTYPGPSVVTAGGSAYVDQVARVLGPLAGPDTAVVVRSGAYMIHDDGFYQAMSPFTRSGSALGGQQLRSAMHVWARVVSRPEPGLAILDAGRRDVSFDEGLPTPQLAAPRLGAPTRPQAGEISAVNDQHAYLRLDPADPLAVGEVVRLGLSHPCTVFDKWRWIPVVADQGDDPEVVELVRTHF